MKKMKRLVAILLTMAMVLGMSITAFAAEPSKDDEGDITIKGISGKPTVTLYKVAEGDYDDDGKGLIGYNWAEGVSFSVNSETRVYQPTAKEITEVANKLINGEIKSLEDVVIETEDSETYTKKVSVGAYIAVITGANDGTVYNPVFLTVSYDGDGKIKEGTVDVSNAKYAYGTTAVAKKTTPNIDKTVAGTTPDDDKNTASVGDVLTYTITPTMPSYPVEAVNKTFFIADTMSAGLTFDYATLNITINGQTLVKDEDGNIFKVNENDADAVAVAYETENGFNLNFNYATLIGENGAVNTPIITYDAIVNGNAVVGNNGNVNDAELYYTNTPNAGESWTTPQKKPDGAEGIVKKEDSETVYTYQLSFLKTGEGDDAEGLAGAVFGIYTDEACTKMIDKVTSNDNGYAVSTNVKAGTYYVKELVAPDGYSLNTAVYEMTAKWSTATRKDTATVTDSTYTTTKPSDDAIQVGWIKDGRFYAMDEYTEDTAKKAGVVPAYLSSTSTTTTSTETIEKNSADGNGTVALDTAIPNTKLVELPSTGGIGTTIFTIVGCLIMVAAVGMFFVSRRRENI